MTITKTFNYNDVAYWQIPCVGISASISFEAIGAGGHGSRTGNGGSGGAYCKSIVFKL